MPALDGVVLEHLADRLFTPDRLQIILEAYIARSADADVSRRENLSAARRALTEAQGKISRLLELVEQGLMVVNDQGTSRKGSTDQACQTSRRRAGATSQRHWERRSGRNHDREHYPPLRQPPPGAAE